MSDELDEYLAGRSDLSRRYAQAPRPEPPPALQRAVLAAARGAQPHRSWAAAFGLAASVLLALGACGAWMSERAAPRAAPPAHWLPVRLENSAAQRPPPAEWLQAIAALKRAGQHDAATAELRRFRLTYPRYPIPSED